ERLQALFGAKFGAPADEGPTTVAGLLNSIAGHVPAPGENIDYDGLRFEVLEANQRKVLRLRARRLATAAAPHQSDRQLLPVHERGRVRREDRQEGRSPWTAFPFCP